MDLGFFFFLQGDSLLLNNLLDVISWRENADEHSL